MPRAEHLAPFLWGVQAGLVNWKHRQYDARREGNGGIPSIRLCVWSLMFNCDHF